MIRKAIAVLMLTIGWLVAALFLIYMAGWSLGAILLNSSIVYEVTAAANLLIAIGTFVAFFLLARRVVAGPKETDDLQ